MVVVAQEIKQEVKQTGSQKNFLCKKKKNVEPT